MVGRISDRVEAATANVKKEYTLNKGEFLQIEQPAELSGSPIQSDKPVALWGGHSCLYMPTDKNACDSAQQQIPPVKALGHEYVGVRYRGRAGGTDEIVPWRIVGAVKPGSKVSLQVFRRGGTKDLSVTVAEVEPDKARRTAEAETKPQATATTLGIGVSDLSDAQKRELKLKNGVRVEVADGAAARAGLREGDVILSIDNTEISSAKQFESVVGKLDKSRAVTALVRRGDSVNFLIIRPAR